jgi:integrase/recombinase XerD
MQQKTVRKYKRGDGATKRTKKVIEDLTIFEMFDPFMSFKKTEALTSRTLADY